LGPRTGLDLTETMKNFVSAKIQTRNRPTRTTCGITDKCIRVFIIIGGHEGRRSLWICKCTWSPKHDKGSRDESVVTGGLGKGRSSFTMTNLFSGSCANIAVTVSNLLHEAL
jgi:hypothetical protein